MQDDILVSNLEIVFGKRIQKHLGLVQGSSVRAKHAGKDILAGFKNFVGGELTNAVLNVRFSTASIAVGAAEIYVYGTAVVLAPE